MKYIKTIFISCSLLTAGCYSDPLLGKWQSALSPPVDITIGAVDGTNTYNGTGHAYVCGQDTFCTLCDFSLSGSQEGSGSMVSTWKFFNVGLCQDSLDNVYCDIDYDNNDYLTCIMPDETSIMYDRVKR